MWFVSKLRSGFGVRDVLSAALICLALVVLPISSEGAGRQFLKGYVPEGVASARVLGRMDSRRQMRLAIGLPLRNQEALDKLLEQLADPQSPNYRHYLTSTEFAEQFGPLETDYQALQDFMRANGFSIVGTHPNRTLLDVSGTVQDIESTFHISMMNWNHPTRGTFFAPDREPSLDAGVTILGVSGLDNFSIAKPMDLKSRAFSSTNSVQGATPLTTGSGPANLFVGNDFRAAYAPGVTLNGTGQTVGLFELDGFYASDVQANFKQAGLPAVPLRTVLLDGFNGTPGSANVEVTLDIMMAAYMAPGSNIIVYEGTNWNDVLNRMATDNQASVLSSSWCFSPTDATTEQIFKQMIAQGQSLFQASGDSGAYHGAVMPPADDPNVTVVGGTSLTTAGAGGAWQSETTWSDSGGGVSTVWPIPSYQQSINMTAVGGSATRRNIPDVALTADLQIFLICNKGQWMEVGGTSAAAPLWAGYIALANQQAAANQKARVGFINPAIYAIGAGSTYQNNFHDVVTGNNSGFNAAPGYDLATGWGTPSGQTLINSLTGTTNPPSFSLSAPGSAVPVAAGTSAAITITVNPQQGFSGAVNLAVSGLPAGITGTFSPVSATTTSTLTLVASASVSASTVNLTITGTSGSLTSTTNIALSVTPAPSFSISATPSSMNLTQGGTSTSTIAVAAQNGFSGAVALGVSGLPSGVTASFGAAASNGSRVMTLTAASSTTPGVSNVTVTGSSGAISSTATISVNIAAANAFTLTASPASVTVPQGGSTTSTITVMPRTGFSGIVNFSASGMPPGVTATFSPANATGSTTLTLRAAANAAGNGIVAVTGTGGGSTSSTNVAITISAAAGFTLSATPASVSLNAGASGSSTIAINTQNGFNAGVTLSISGLPAGVSAKFGPLSAARTSTLTFTATNSAAANGATVTVTGTSGLFVSKTTIALTVTKNSSFALSASPSTLNIPQGSSASSSLTLTAQNGFTNVVTLSISSLPAGVTGSFSAGITPASCVLTLKVSGTAARTSSTVTITGKSGTLVQTVSINLSVLPPGSGKVAVSMAAAYNVMGAVSDGARFLSSDGIDGAGRAYSGNLLGTTRTVGGSSFTFGTPNTAGAATGTTIALPPGNYSTLKLLATGVNGNQVSQRFIVSYNDGTSATFTQSLSDWCTPQGYAGESTAVAMPYRNNSTGSRDARPVNLYAYSFTLASAKTVKSISLPDNRNVVVFGITLEVGSSASADGGAQNPIFDKTHIILYPAEHRAKR